MNARVVAATLLLLSVDSVSAQTICETNCTVRVGQPFDVVADAMPDEVSGCRLWVNGAPSPAVGVFVDGRIEFAFPQGFDRGAYTFYLTCRFLSGVEGVYTDTGTLTVQRGRPRFRSK